MPTTDHVTKRGQKYYFRAIRKGKVFTRSLDTRNRQEAVARAKHLYQALLRDEWNPGRKAPEKREERWATVDEVVNRYLRSGLVRAKAKTRRENVTYLLKILRVGYGWSNEDAGGAGLDCLSADLVRAWQEAAMDGIPDGEVKRRDSAAVSANAGLRFARSLFCKHVMESGVYSGLNLPDLSGFMGAPKLRELPRDSYEPPRADIFARVVLALPLLRERDPAVWAAFQLAARAGLRRGEVIAARWHWLEVGPDGAEAVRVQLESDWVAKGRRGRVVPVPAGLRADLAAVLGEGKPGDRVLPVESHGAGLKVFRRLAAWMVAHGWDRAQKAHELRKVFATAVAAAHGGYAAQAVLGHSDIKTTARYAARPVVGAVDPLARYAGG